MPVILIRYEIPPHIFEKFSSVKLYEHRSGGSRIVPCVGTDVKKVVLVSINVANAPTNQALSKFSELFIKCNTDSMLCTRFVRDGLINYMEGYDFQLVDFTSI